MFNGISSLPETPEAVAKPRYAKKHYLAIGLALIAIVTIASIIVFTQFLPSVRGGVVPLGMSYNVGEKMTYEYNTTIQMMNRTTSTETTLEIEVLSF